MSRPKPPNPAKLIIGVFMQDKELIRPVSEKFQDRFGEMDIISRWIPFDYTDYYESEMGRGLARRLMAFKNLVRQDQLSDIKQFTLDLENQNLENGSRLVNIDPGYLLQERFVLATGKNFAHRIYIGKNIYADLTLVYREGQFQALPWTYPDYLSPEVLRFLERARNKYIHDFKTYGPDS